MALIRCSECGREISDKAAACIHCGCPISVTAPRDNLQQSAGGASRRLSLNLNVVLSGADHEQSPQTVYVPELGRNVEFPIDNDIKVGETYEVTLREGSKYDSIIFTVSSIIKKTQTSSVNTQNSSDAIATLRKYKPNFLARLFKKQGFSGFFRKFISMTIVFIVAGRFGDIDMEVILPILGVCVVLLFLGGRYPFAHLKGFCRRHHIDEAIRQDTGYMNVAIVAYNTLPTRKMLAYIKGLNPAAAQEIERQLAEKKNK